MSTITATHPKVKLQRTFGRLAVALIALAAFVYGITHTDGVLQLLLVVLTVVAGIAVFGYSGRAYHDYQTWRSVCYFDVQPVLVVTARAYFVLAAIATIGLSAEMYFGSSALMYTSLSGIAWELSWVATAAIVVASTRMAFVRMMDGDR